MKHPWKKPNMEKEYNKARSKILEGRREAEKDQEIQDKIDEKEIKKEA